MRVLIACEESQTICKVFRKLGHDAFSCDLLPCSGGHPEWHFQTNVIPLLNNKWDLIIAHPPCTYLTCSGNRWFSPGNDPEGKRKKAQEDALEFFSIFLDLPHIPYVCIENPVGAASRLRKPDQIIQPFQFGDPVRKTTCLWLKNLPLLKPTRIVEPELVTLSNGKTDSLFHYETFRLPPAERSRVRSKTFPGIAAAMGEQWGSLDFPQQLLLF